ADEVEIVGTAEGPFLDDAAVFVGRRMIMPDQRIRRLEVAFGKRILLGREPPRALPAIDRAEDRAQLLHAIIAGRAFQWSRGRALLVGIMRRENVGIGLFVLDPEIALGRIGAEATWIDAHHVDRRLAVDNPFGQLPAGTAR